MASASLALFRGYYTEENFKKHQQLGNIIHAMKRMMHFVKEGAPEWRLACCMGGCLFLLLLLSCSWSAGTKSAQGTERVQNVYYTETGWEDDRHNVHNIYGVVNMELFHGFETKVTVEEMQNKHGEPSRVYNARKVSRVEGYDVWEYDIQFGKIECYVKKDDKVVDYIFRKFSEPRSLCQIVTDGQVARNLMADKKRVDYLSDDFKNTLVFFKQDASASSDLIASIALDVDVPMPEEPLRSTIEQYSKMLPLALAVSCRMTSLSYKHHVVSIVCDVLGSSSDDIIAKMKSGRGFGYQFALFLFGDKGVFSDMKAKLQEEKADIKLTFKSENSKVKTVFKINAGSLLKSQTTARQRLKAMVAIYNMRLMNLDYYKSEVEMELADDVVYLLENCEGSFKSRFKDCTLDNDSYYQDLLVTCARSGVGLNFVFTCTDSETEMSYSNRYAGHKEQNNSIERYCNDELKEMRAEIK